MTGAKRVAISVSLGFLHTAAFCKISFKSLEKRVSKISPYTSQILICGSTIGTNLSPNVLLAFTTGTTNCSTNLSYQSRLFAGCAGAGFAGSGAEFKV